MREWIKWLVAKQEMIELERWRVEWEEHRRWMAEFEVCRATLDHMRASVDGQPVNYIQTLRDSFRTDAALSPPGRAARLAALLTLLENNSDR